MISHGQHGLRPPRPAVHATDDTPSARSSLPSHHITKWLFDSEGTPILRQFPLGLHEHAGKRDAHIGLPPKSWRRPLCCVRLDGSDLLVIDRRQQPRRAVPTLSVVEIVARGRDDGASLGLGSEVVPREPSCSRVEKNASLAALSKHDPTRPIDCRIPSRRHNAVKVLAV
jgi:hypothetical protein